MMDYMVNWISIVLAAIACMILGMIWYNPNVFGTMWMKMAGIKMKGKPKMSEMLTGMFLGLLSYIVLAWALAVLMLSVGMSSFADATFFGFFVWLGFVATIMLGIVLWEMKPFKLYVLNAAYQLIALLISAAIIYAGM